MKIMLFAMLLASSATNPQQYMEAGQAALRANNWSEVRLNFQSAINTNRLNDAGRAVSYWNLYWAESQMKLDNHSMNSLLGFIVYGSDFLKAHPKSLIVRSFQFKRKLTYAIITMQATWAKNNNYSCRSDIFPCYIESIRFINTYEKIMPFCVGNSVHNIRVVKEKSALRVEVTCTSGIENYYFTYEH